MSPQAAAQRTNEPSMEEILASIRKIISDDQKALEAEVRPAASVAPAAAPAPAAMAPRAVEPPFIAPDVSESDDEDVLDLELATETPMPSPVEPRLAEPARHSVQPAQESTQEVPLISDIAASAAGRSFQSLANMVFSQNARTLDDVVRDMLRPMLQSWLDENLPSLVERLVRAEIERVARGGR